MAETVWEVVRCEHCDRVDEDVTLEVCRVYPIESLPDQPPRVIARRCSRAVYCNQLDRPTCQWAGTAPGYDPFA
jgi:hypothetical protein